MNLGEFMTLLSYDLNEPDNTFPLGSWPRAEMVGFLNRAEKEWLRLTGMDIDTYDTIVPPGGGILVAKPPRLHEIRRVSFAGRNLDLQTAELFELQDRYWRDHTKGQPSMYHEDRLPFGFIELNKVPSYGGVCKFMGTVIWPDYTGDDTEELHVNDYWEPYIRWKVLELALKKECEDRDLARANHAVRRFLIGVRLARYIMRGVERINFSMSGAGG